MSKGSTATVLVYLQHVCTASSEDGPPSIYKPQTGWLLVLVWLVCLPVLLRAAADGLSCPHPPILNTTHHTWTGSTVRGLCSGGAGGEGEPGIDLIIEEIELYSSGNRQRSKCWHGKLCLQPPEIEMDSSTYQVLFGMVVEKGMKNRSTMEEQNRKGTN